jgi:mono/diheme cytochrome c family protein
MKAPAKLAMAVAAAALLGQVTAFAQKPAVDPGKREYDSNCALCHGTAGKGDGPYGEVLKLTRPMPDITQLAKKNGGVFPIARVYEIIDGRTGIAAHGTAAGGPRAMPIWGSDYIAEASTWHIQAPADLEAYTRMKILALVDYLYRIQAK